MVACETHHSLGGCTGTMLISNVSMARATTDYKHTQGPVLWWLTSRLLWMIMRRVMPCLSARNMTLRKSYTSGIAGDEQVQTVLMVSKSWVNALQMQRRGWMAQYDVWVNPDAPENHCIAGVGVRARLCICQGFTFGGTTILTSWSRIVISRMVRLQEAILKNQNNQR